MIKYTDFEITQLERHNNHMAVRVKFPSGDQSPDEEFILVYLNAPPERELIRWRHLNPNFTERIRTQHILPAPAPTKNQEAPPPSARFPLIEYSTGRDGWDLARVFMRGFTNTEYPL